MQTAYEQLAFNEEQLRKQIEENKSVTETLNDTKTRYYEFFKTARDSVFITTPDGRWIDFNDATLELFGYESREELFNVSVLSIYAHPEDRSSFLKRVELEGYVKEFPLQLKKCNGKTFDTLINIVPIREQDGSIKAFIGSIRDITEQKQMETTLRESEKKYCDIIDNMQDVVYRTDLEGKLIMFSPHGVKLAGYDSVEEMIGFDVALDTYQNPKERERFLAALKEKGFVENFPLVLQARHGRIRQVTASSHFYYDDKGNVLGVEGILHDITDLKEKEQELLASEERYRALYNDNPIMLFTLDPNRNIFSVNQAGADQLGYTAGELEGQSVLKVFYSDDQRELTERLQICLKFPGERFHWQFRNVRKDGTLIWVDEYARTIISSKGDLNVLVVCQDITDRKLVEEALKINQFQLSEAMNLAQMAKWQFDVDSGIFTFDDSFYSLYSTNAKFEGGYMMPADVYANKFVHPDDLHIVADEVNKAIQATDPAYESKIEHRIIRRDGEIRHIIVRIGITKDENGKTIKTHGVNQDITQRKLEENAVHMANHKLNLLSSITRHDINNQLLIQQGYLEILQKKQRDPSFNEYVQKVITAAERISALIRFTREYEEIGVNAHIWQDCRTLVDTAAKQALLKQVIVNNILPTGVEVYADPLIVKVFYNLMDNAVRYGGNITTIRFFVHESRDDHLIVCEDDGEGIPIEEKEKIFERGFGKNTGLGLALSREILDITDITIRETRVPGKGARFEITVPKGKWRYGSETS